VEIGTARGAVPNGSDACSDKTGYGRMLKVEVGDAAGARNAIFVGHAIGVACRKFVDDRRYAAILIPKKKPMKSVVS